MILNTILLDAAAAEGGGFGSIIMIVAMIAIFYFFMIRPQNQRQKKIREERERLAKGSKVITQGGLVGHVREIRDNDFVIEIADGVKVTVLKEYVFAVPEEEAKKAENK